MIVRALGGGRVVGHHHDRLAELRVQLLEQGEDVVGARAIEVARRLVGDDDRRVVDDGARDRDALLLPAGELPRVVLHPVLEADDAERGLRALLALGRRELREQERQLDVLERREHRHAGCTTGRRSRCARAPLGELALAHPSSRFPATSTLPASAGRARR